MKLGRKPIPVLTRFWSYVQKGPDNSCWPWLGAKTTKGYGLFTTGPVIRRKHQVVTRVAFKIAYGPFDERLNICHTCDNPSCVNPRHLFVGTSQDNHDDCVAKGRSLKGERHPMRKLTESDVLKIRDLRSSSRLSFGRLAEQFGISRTTAHRVCAKIIWGHI